VNRLLTNIESILEGVLLFVMIVAAGVVVLFAWPIREIYDSWGVPDDID